MANDKTSILVQNIQKIIDKDFENKTCIEFIDSVWGLCRDNCEYRLTGLLGGFQSLYRQPLSEEVRMGCDKICKFLEQFTKLVRAKGVTTADDCRKLIRTQPLAVEDIDLLITNVCTQVAMNAPDIQCIANALIPDEAEVKQYTVGYSQITSTGVVTVPGVLVLSSGDNCTVKEVPANVKSQRDTTWFLSTVTSNADEDRLDRRNPRKTTMNSRKRLYPLYARVPVENLAKFMELLPNCGETCIPGWVCEVKPAFPRRKGE